MVRRLVAVAACFFLVASAAVHAQVNITTFHNDNSRSGVNNQETVLTPTNVNSKSFGKLWTTSVDGLVYAQPLYLSSINIGGITHNVVFIATEHDSVYAMDSDTGKIYWQKSLIAAGGTTVASVADLSCTDVNVEIGITGTPVIDTTTGTLYVIAKYKLNNAYYQYLHALDVGTGAEKFGGPTHIENSVPGTGVDSSGGILAFNSKMENNRPGLLLENGHVIVAWAAHCDRAPWHGWLMSYSASTLAQEATYASSPNGFGNGIWMSAGGVAADSDGNTYFSTGNGSWNGTTDLGDSVVKLGPVAAGLKVLDYFTPYNQNAMNSTDSDLSAGGVVLMPATTTGKLYVTTIGKDGKIYLLDRTNLGKYCVVLTPACGASNPQIVQEIPDAFSGMWGTPAVWNNTIYWAGGNDNTGEKEPLKAFAYNAATGIINATPASQSNELYGFSGPSPSISASGNTNGILWGIDNHNVHYTCVGAIHCQTLIAYDATNLAKLLYTSDQAASGRDVPGGALKFTAPVIANGKVFVGSVGAVSGYGLLAGATPAAAPVLSLGTGTYTSAQKVTITDSTAGTAIYYTTNGTTPTASSVKYTGTLTISTTTTLKAVAIATGYATSAAASATYTINTATMTAAAAPALSLATGTYNSAQTVTLTDSTAGAVIYYTLDGSTPSTASTKYTGALSIGTTTTVKAIAAATGFTNSSVTSATYTISIPTQTNAYTAVSLAANVDVNALSSDGVAVTGGGIDGLGYAYSRNLLGTSVNWNGTTFTIGKITDSDGDSDAVSSETIALTAGNYASLNLLATGVRGAQAAQKFVVNYTDGTSTTVTQSLSDWFTPQNYAGESKAVTMAYRVTPTGAKGTGPFYLYGYNFALNSAKTVKSLTLPTNRYVVVFGVNLVAPATTSSSSVLDFSALANVSAIFANGNAVTNGGIDGYSFAYSGNVLGAAQTWNGMSFKMPAFNRAGGIANATVPLTAGKYSTINLLATAVNGAQPNQDFVVTYTDGTTKTITQSLSDWFTPQNYAGESKAVTMGYRVSASGAPTAGTYYLYGYSLSVDTTKTVKSLKLPANRNVVVISITQAAAGGATGGNATSSAATVAFGASANVAAVFANGNKVTNGGIDGLGYAYTGNLLGATVTWSSTTFKVPPFNALDAVANTSVTLPTGSYSSLKLLATSVRGNQPSQVFVITYTDGTTTSVTQNMSDWFTPQNYAGESKAVTMGYRVAPDGTTSVGPYYLYGYSLALNAAKIVKSVTLPASRYSVIVAATLVP